MNAKVKRNRINVELKQLRQSAKNHGITCTTAVEASDDLSQLIATMKGPNDSAYEEGIFKVGITIGEQYPFRPPTFKFLTPIFHPNIDSSGKICLDLLRMPPTGSYNPAISLESLLLSIQLLLASPNPNDPLQGDAADLYRTNRAKFCEKAKEYVRKYCTKVTAEATAAAQATKTSQQIDRKEVIEFDGSKQRSSNQSDEAGEETSSKKCKLNS